MATTAGAMFENMKYVFHIVLLLCLEKCEKGVVKMSDELFICQSIRHEKCKCTLFQANLISFFDYNNSNTRSDLVSLIADGKIAVLKRHIEESKGTCVTDKHGNSPLHLSVIFKKYDVFNYLLTVEGLNIDALNRYGHSCMHLSVVSDNIYFITQLINRGADVNVPDRYSCTPLHAAAVRYSPRVCKVLLENGADLNFQNLLGQTALFHACQYGTLDSIYMLLCFGADARITDVHGVLPLTAAMQRSVNRNGGPISKSHQECHEILFNYTFEKKAIAVNLVTLTAAMKINSPLFPEILEKADKVTYSRDDIADLGRCAVFIDPNLFEMFAKNYGHVVREMLLSPSELYHGLEAGEDVDGTLVKFMDFIALVAAHQENLNLAEGSMSSFVSSLVALLKLNKISFDTFEKVTYFLYSYGLPCELLHIAAVYENLGFCEILKFMLDSDVIVTFERPGAVMPYLLCHVKLTIEKFIDLVIHPSTQYVAALRYFANKKVREFLRPVSEEVVERTPPMPTLLELSRDAARQHIIRVFRIKNAREFYRLIKKMPINDVYKKILTYEKELYTF